MNHTDAKIKADRLCCLLGAGWTPRVWENLGWQGSAVKNAIEVMSHSYPRLGKVYYNAYFRPHSTIVGSSNTSPEGAVRNLRLKFIEARIRDLEFLVILLKSTDTPGETISAIECAVEILNGEANHNR